MTKPFSPQRLSMTLVVIASLLFLFSSPIQAQVVVCPPTLELECSDLIPAPDPSLVMVTSNCTTPDCCDGSLTEYCNADLDDCMKVALTCITADADCNPVFRFKIYNTCQQALSNIAFNIPAGASGTFPTGGMSYNDPCGITNWNVETPNGGPDAGTLKFEGQLENGESTCFEFTLFGLDKLPANITVNPKYGPNELFVTIPTMGCGSANVESITHQVDKTRPVGCSGTGICRIYRVNYDCPLLASGRQLCEQLVVKADDTDAPEFTFVPADATLECSDPVEFGMPVAQDDCGVATIVEAGTFVLGGCPGETVHVRRWKAKDDCNNFSGAIEQRLTVPAACCPPLDGGLQEFSLDGKAAPFQVAITPNPAQSRFQLNISGLTEGDVTIAVYDLSGKMLYGDSMTSVSNPTLFFNTEALGMKNGLYLIRVETKNETITHKLMIQL